MDNVYDCIVTWEMLRVYFTYMKMYRVSQHRAEILYNRMLYACWNLIETVYLLDISFIVKQQVHYSLSKCEYIFVN